MNEIANYAAAKPNNSLNNLIGVFSSFNVIYLYDI